MTTRKLERSEWGKYFDEVAKRLPAMRVGVSILGDDIGAQLETENGVLLGMSYDSNGEVFEIATSNISHRITKPKAIHVREAGGTLSSVEVIAPDDTKQIVELRSLPSLPVS